MRGLRTSGRPVGGHFHTIKAEGAINGLNNLLEEENHE